MSLQSLYRLERDGIYTVERENYYYAYKISESKKEIHIYEIYIKKEMRGNSKIYYDEIFKDILSMNEIELIVGFVYPNTIGAERSLMSILKYGFRLHSANNNKITLVLEIKNG